MIIQQRILYVEDEADLRAVVKLVLETMGGFVVKTCSCGDDALRAVELFAPDLIILDVMMPGMDGPGLLTALRRIPTLEKVPVAFMTANLVEMDTNYLKSLGACEVIAKPFDPLRLVDQILEILTEYGQL